MEAALKTLEATAVHLDVSFATVKKLIRDGKLEIVRVSGRNRRVPLASINAFIASGVTASRAKRTATSKS